MFTFNLSLLLAFAAFASARLSFPTAYKTCMSVVV
jgi:hypothetical protein